MKTQLTITPDPIDGATLIAERQLSGNMGAVLTFHGVVRSEEAGEQITALDYEANEEMARHQFGLIFAAIDKLWPVESVRLIHRVGIVAVNESSLWVEVIAPHRAEAFAACQFLIDEMKGKVPIWKRPKQL
jgi:molybdopterin synthase catalytic subunit